MAKEDIILRSTVNAPLTTKGSALTHAQFDANWIEIYNALVSLSQSSYVSAYDAAITYDDTILNYVTYSSQIWKMINATPQVNVTPGTDANTWVKVYATDLVGRTQLFSVKKTLTANEINNGNSSPISLTAKYPNFFIDLFSVTIALNAGSVHFDASTLHLRQRTATDNYGVMSTINSASSFKKKMILGQAEIVSGENLEVYFNSDGSSSPLGDGTIDVYLTYKITAI
jgi:hypothetical protein